MRLTLLKILLYCFAFSSISIPMLNGQCGPTVQLGADITFCLGNTITINATDPACPQATYMWNNGPGTPTITTSPTLQINTTGLYFVTITNGSSVAVDSIRVQVDQPPQLFLGVDHNICVGTTETLSVPFYSGTSYLWQNGDTSNAFLVTTPGTYFVTVTNSCGTFSDTVTIGNDQPSQVTLPADVLLCSLTDSVYTIIPNSFNGQLTWPANFLATNSLTVNQSGFYAVFATNSCGTVSDSIRVTFNDGVKLNLPDTIATCPGTPVQLQTNLTVNVINNGSLLWSTNSTAPSINVNNAGTYWVEYTNACGTFRDSTIVVNSASALVVNLGPDTTICDNTNVTLTPDVIGTSYLWSNNRTTRSITTSNSGTYWVDVITSCGTFRDSIVVNTIPAIAPSVPDTLHFCAGGSVIAIAGPPPNAFRQYQWSGGGTNRNKGFNQPGNYWVRRIGSCGPIQKNFVVVKDEPRIPVLYLDTLDCVPALKIILDSGFVATDSVLWSTGDFNVQESKATDTGWYSVTIFNKCGVYTDSVYVDFRRPPAPPENPVYICPNDSVRIGKGTAEKETSYFWPATGDTTPFIYVNQPGSYSYTALNSCDTITFTVDVFLQGGNYSTILGPDTSACLGDSVIFYVPKAGTDSIVWHNVRVLPGDTIAYTPFARAGPTAPRVDIYTTCGVFRDTVQVGRYRPFSYTLTDSSMCFGDSILMDATNSAIDNYLWSNGDTTASTYVKNGGFITLEASNGCYTVADSAFITLKSALNQINLGPDTIFCNGLLTLDPNLFGPNLSYMWQDGSTSPTYTVGITGNYYVTVSDSCGSVSDTINVIITGPPQLVLGTEVTYCSNSTFTLNAQNFGSKYLWSTGDTTQSLTVPSPGKYWVTIGNLCDTITDTVDVLIDYPINNYELGPDTLICPGDTLHLRTGYPEVTTIWQDASTDSIFDVVTPGKYYATLTNRCGTRFDTIDVGFVEPPVFQLEGNPVICSANDSIDLKAPSGSFTYLWNTNETDSIINVNQPGIYWVTLTNLCGLTYTDSVEVETDFPVSIALGPDTVLCEGEQLLLETGIQDYDVVWEDGSRNSSRTISGSGTYIATVTNRCGVFDDTLKVSLIEDLELEPEEFKLCDDDTLVIDLRDEDLFDGASIDGYQVYWRDGYPDSLRTITQSGDYELVFQNRCNDYFQIFTLRTGPCQCPIHIASAFTPNGDGRNDLFKLGAACDIESYELRILNRWGEQVFMSKNIDDSWDGTNNGVDTPSGVYTYRLYFVWRIFEQVFEEEKIGTVTVIR
jgi:gliding motility-associated-like protein